MDNTIQHNIDNLNSAYTGSSIRERLLNLFTQLFGTSSSGGFAAKYLGGVLATDFVTKKDLYKYFTDGNYLAYSFDAADRTSNKAMSTALFEKSFGNATELYNRFDYDYGIQKKGK